MTRIKTPYIKSGITLQYGAHKYLAKISDGGAQAKRFASLP